MECLNSKEATDIINKILNYFPGRVSFISNYLTIQQVLQNPHSSNVFLIRPGSKVTEVSIEFKQSTKDVGSRKASELIELTFSVKPSYEATYRSQIDKLEETFEFGFQLLAKFLKSRFSKRLPK